MVYCKTCGCELPKEAKFCRECGSEVVVEEPANGTKFCINCGFEIPKAAKFCSECGLPTGSSPQTKNGPNSIVRAEKSPGLAAVLSFLIVGLGQIYLGLTKKGILLFIGAMISGVLMLLIIGWLTWLVIWGYGIYDAYNSAQKMNSGIAVEDTIDFNNLF